MEMKPTLSRYYNESDILHISDIFAYSIKVLNV